MVPSSFIISQITPFAFNPARRARSTEPSVWPDLTITPPFFALKGNMCPGRTRSSGFALSAVAARIVVARSAAEIPVVTPSLASMDIVNPVSNCEVLLSTISGRPRVSRSAPVIERQSNHAHVLP